MRKSCKVSIKNRIRLEDIKNRIRLEDIKNRELHRIECNLMVSGVVYCLHSVLSNSLYFWSLLFFTFSTVLVLYANSDSSRFS